MNVSYSVVIPCLNEAYSIVKCVESALEELSKFDEPFEIIVVDNGSNDSTADLAKRAGASVFSYTEQKGYGAAMDYGVLQASGDVIIVVDGDGSYDFSKLGALLRLIESGYDFVNGNRFSDSSPKKGAMPWHHRLIGNPLLSKIVNILYKGKIVDVHSGLYAFRSDVYPLIYPTSSGFEACSEIVIRALKCDLKLKEVNIDLYCTHPSRKSKLRSFRDGSRHLVLALFYLFGDSTARKLVYSVGMGSDFRRLL